MTPYENKGYIKSLLFDSIPIENYIFSLHRTSTGSSNKIVYFYFE